jgi:hypothetical protein
MARKTAGEIHHIKQETASTGGNWAWSNNGPRDRKMYSNHDFNPKASKQLARVLRSSLYALGHLMSAYSTFAKMKSRDMSPDGRLGGKGYIQDIKGIRKDYMNCVEALSSITDTLYDEISGPHWAALSRSPEFEAILAQLEEVKEDPEQWAEEQEDELEEEAVNASVEGKPEKMGKTAGLRRQASASKIADLYIRRHLNG